ncbi:TauD/TfdA family dioxygenase [Prescottella sp. R16]|uniref:TauD/TfdA dioxygenase family protein n=1 Tax=Prescottella sp. R16 TaxID=3064529 RepID=UPI00272DD559|nr:TauD/TfdA family dioxygenase [Prescottella sp. R16]
MSTSELHVQRLAHALGAEVAGIDLSRPLDADVVKEIRDLFHEHQVLFFRDQHIDDVAHRDFAVHFGPLQRFAFLSPVSESVPEVHAIDIDPTKPKTANSDIWHSDATFLARPPLGSMLRAVILPDVGGDTLWASMYAAYDALSSRMQRLLDGMTAVHDSSNSVSHARNAVNADFQPTSHPVVRTHPVTGRKALFVNKIFTTRIEGLTDRENDALLPMLTDHVRSPDFQVRFRWEPGSIALWDNRCTQHYAVADYASRRRMHRVVIDGDEPV